MQFQHTAARRRLVAHYAQLAMGKMFQHTAARRRLAHRQEAVATILKVSTHSRPKAAGPTIKYLMVKNGRFQHTAARRRLVPHVNLGALRQQGFNTQPPEGGWTMTRQSQAHPPQFQHTAARRRLESKPRHTAANAKFQHTAARRRLACLAAAVLIKGYVSTHSRPKAAG